VKTVLLRYNSGNIKSVFFALKRIGINAIVTDSAGKMMEADRVIIPGVGEAGSALRYIREKKLDTAIKNLKVPVLGICLGMQIMFEHMEEGGVPGIGIMEGSIKKFPSGNKIPHTGWNTVYSLKDSLFNEIGENSAFYFVHSYYAKNSLHSIALSNYGKEFASAVRKRNFYGVQFHPEKSGKNGEKILQNFFSNNIFEGENHV